MSKDPVSLTSSVEFFKVQLRNVELPELLEKLPVAFILKTPVCLIVVKELLFTA
ncbi:hypothetical protein D3C85_1875710 [compost metagenome]